MPTNGGERCLEYDKTEANYLSAIFCLFTALSAICAVLNAEWLLVDDPLLDSFEEADAFFGLAAAVNTSSAQFAFNGSSPLAEKPGATLLLPCTNIGARVFWLPARFGIISRDDGKYFNTFHLQDQIVLINCINPAVAYLFYLSIAFSFVVVGLAALATLLQLFRSSLKFFNWLKDYIVMEICCAIVTPLIFLLVFRAKNEVQKMRPTSSVVFGSGMFYIFASGAFALVAATLSLHQKSRLQKTRRMDNQQLICTRSLRSWRNNIGQTSGITNIPANSRDLERYLMDLQSSSSSQVDSHSASGMVQ